jgi:hypothetical protein
MNEHTQQQLDRIAKWAEQCDQELARLRWQLLADRLQKKAA